MEQKWVSKELAVVEVYIGMYGYVCLRTHGYGTWGTVEVNTQFRTIEDLDGLIEALCTARDMTEVYDVEATDGK